jgi:adenine deaminase
MNRSTFTIKGQYVSIPEQSIFPAEVAVENGRIKKVSRLSSAPQQYILPGFTDAHIHIESSMLLPAEFARIAVTHGTVSTVSDPHEIANVCGIAGIDFMIANGNQSPFKFNFGAPSCVPATNFETAGAVIDSLEIERLLQREEIKYLSEMMNFPGVLNGDAEVMAKIAVAKKAGKPIDGHAPGLRGEAAQQYASAGISTDHECFTKDEALDKLKAGMYIIIREGSAAKNFDALISLLKSHPGKIMFCSDDKHPHELMKGHINQLVVRALEKGCDLFDTLYAACVLPVRHYGLEVGLLQPGDAADFIVVRDLKHFEILQTYLDGILVAENGKCLIEKPGPSLINHFNCTEKKPADFILKTKKNLGEIRVAVIDALDGQLITNASEAVLEVTNSTVASDVRQDILKIGVVNRYEPGAPVAMGFVRNFGLKKGAIASSVAHDSHNIVFAGVDEESICSSVNSIIRASGGISVCDGATTKLMPLPVAGLMTDKDALQAAKEYEDLDAAAKALGSKLSAPFMTLSFMALPVIPSLKITDKGLFDVDEFQFTELYS